jgi:hypothetical protein
MAVPVHIQVVETAFSFLSVRENTNKILPVKFIWKEIGRPADGSDVAPWNVPMNAFEESLGRTEHP